MDLISYVLQRFQFGSTKRDYPACSRQFARASMDFSSRILEMSIQIPFELVQMADAAALTLLSSNPNLIPYATNVHQLALTQFAELGLSATCSLTSFSDPEDEDANTLMFQVRIHGKSYSEILEIWDQLSVRLLSDLPSDIQKSISVVADEA